ncbi:MAG TPA: hypothetical protein VJV79_34540 [Polyangiaceae bacterium]|nr:hypothetical protein [Polyangiaceae bacterium]
MNRRYRTPSVVDRLLLRTRQLSRMAQLLRWNLTSKRPAVAPAGPVVSLTTHGARARTVAFTLESIAQGAVLPSRLILWLDEPALVANPSAMMRRLQSRGVEIRHTENFGPHTKYYPFVASQSSFEVPLVTADDDVLYAADWLALLKARHEQLPDLVHCHRARVVGLENGQFTPYQGWQECATTEPSHRHFSIGMAGALFPPAVLQELRQRGDSFRQSCPRADDIWLNVQALRVGAKVQQVHSVPEYFMLLPGTQNMGLLHSNFEGGNDTALRAVYEPADLTQLERAN